MSLDTAALAAPDERTVVLLERVKNVFVAKGFDGASMQDLARAAGISAGNFYRYFPSKNAIIEAMVELDLAAIEADFVMIMRAPDPDQALRAAIRHRIEVPDKDGALWAEIEAAALRKAEIGAISSRFQTAVVGHLVRVFARIAGVPDEDAMRRFSAHAELVVMLVKGTTISNCAGPDGRGLSDAPQIKALVLRVLDHVLGEVSGGGAPGGRA